MDASRQPRYLELVTPFLLDNRHERAPVRLVPDTGPFRTDPLCRVATRQVILARLETLGELAPTAPLSFLVVKLHGLATLNKEFGFQAGDEALQTVASMVHSCLRATDMVGRLAGASFGIVLQGTGATAAAALAARLAHHLGQVATPAGPIRVTVSAATGTGVNARTLALAASDSLGNCG